MTNNTETTENETPDDTGQSALTPLLCDLMDLWFIDFKSYDGSEPSVKDCHEELAEMVNTVRSGEIINPILPYITDKMFEDFGDTCLMTWNKETGRPDWTVDAVDFACILNFKTFTT